VARHGQNADGRTGGKVGGFQHCCQHPCPLLVVLCCELLPCVHLLFDIEIITTDRLGDLLDHLACSFQRLMIYLFPYSVNDSMLRGLTWGKGGRHGQNAAGCTEREVVGTHNCQLSDSTSLDFNQCQFYKSSSQCQCLAGNNQRAEDACFAGIDMLHALLSLSPCCWQALPHQ
jgi:hypothetical protein